MRRFFDVSTGFLLPKPQICLKTTDKKEMRTILRRLPLSLTGIFFQRYVFALISITLSTDLAYSSSDPINPLDPLDERLKRCMKILQPEDVRKINVMDIVDPDVSHRIAMLDWMNHKGASRWDASQIEFYINNQISFITPRLDGLRKFTNADRGWKLTSAKSAPGNRFELTVQNPFGETLSTTIDWDPLLDAKERLLLDSKIELLQPVRGKIKDLEFKREALRKRKKEFEAEVITGSLKMMRQAQRAIELYPEVFAWIVGESIKTGKSPHYAKALQKLYYEYLVQPEFLSVMKGDGRKIYSARIMIGSDFQLSPHLESIGMKIHTQHLDSGELKMEYFPTRGNTKVQFPEGTEMQLFLDALGSEWNSKHYAFRFIPHNETDLEILFLRYRTLNRVQKEVESDLKFLNSLPEGAFKKEFGKSIKPSPSREYVESVPEQIIDYIRKAYQDANRGLQVKNDDLEKLIRFMKSARNRTDSFVIYQGQNESKRVIGTASLVYSYGAEEKLAVESIVPNFTIERKGLLPVVEISRYALDFSARRTLTSSKFLRLAYYATTASPIQKVVAFCEEEFAQAVIQDSKGAFKAVDKEIRFDGKRYLLLEAKPEDLIQTARDLNLSP